MGMQYLHRPNQNFLTDIMGYEWLAKQNPEYATGCIMLDC